MSKNTESEKLQQDIMEYMIMQDFPITSAKEMGEVFDVTSQRASGALRVLERKGLVQGKSFGSGMHNVKVYYYDKNKVICPI